MFPIHSYPTSHGEIKIQPIQFFEKNTKNKKNTLDYLLACLLVQCQPVIRLKNSGCSSNSVNCWYSTLLSPAQRTVAMRVTMAASYTEVLSSVYNPLV